MRLRIDLAYDGTDFRGWAVQPGQRTVQGVIESALGTMLRLDPTPTLTCAGRTDAGVHARGQVAHVDLDTHPGVLERRLRRYLPDDIRIKSVVEAPPGFDARFAATERRYVYRMTDHPAGPDPLARRMIVHHPRPLSVDLMNAAAEHLLGQHDFAAFCKKRAGATTIRTLLALRTIRGGETIATTVRADAFCHAMVRSLMGCLVAVGERRFPPEFAAEVLSGRVRDGRVKVMEPHGLVLEEVSYPADEDIAARIEQSRRRRDE
ncbi:tRNA pseudouridine synthase A [Aeromicrobium marinum DSM 15272]|uniref:tRNA pseudouridine synthase A n=1 Tax=Aeromicrobium marinum DSM 15272 TaxID=585531 RepID=E2SG52_9ACTN|nr:tRNA pseudouridine(38-40) synthase TruA [Aeromicrobium marinum]EFQ81809.1 tRNA pseudouridine synthase A [Aeromicrobium marinum DSM 15272]